jgi:hypothetical protein
MNYAGFPMQLDIRCPACGARALWDEPFRIVDGKAVANIDPQLVHKWGQRYIIEKYPSVLKWRQDSGKSYRYHHRGVMKCLNCHRVAVHQLDWSHDAFYRWDIRGTILWAWNKAHALDILHYIESSERQPEKFAYCYWLKRLPRPTLSAKVRDLIVKRIRASFVQE